MKAKLTIISVAAIVLITAAAFFMSRSTVRSKVDKAVATKLQASFGAAWEYLELDADAVVRAADRFAARYRSAFQQFVRGQQDLSFALGQQVAKLPPDKKPDLVLVVVQGRVVGARILAAYADPSLLKEKTKSNWLLNRSLTTDVAKKVFEAELKKKPNAPAGSLVPAGWEEPLIATGKLSKNNLFSQDVPTAVAVPVILTLDKSNQPSPSGAPKRLGAMILGWKASRNAAELKETAVKLMTNEELRDKHFLTAYVGLRGLVRKMVLDMEEDLRASGRVPEFVGLVNGGGILLERNKQTEYLVGESLSERKVQLQTTLSRSISLSDIWLVQDLVAETGKKTAQRTVRSTLLRVGLAPMLGDDGQVVGAVCLGWTLSDKAAAHLKETLSVDVVFLEGDRFTASSGDVSSVPKSVLATVKQRRVEAKKISLADLTAQYEGLKGIHVAIGKSRYLAAAGVIAGARQAGNYTYMIFVSHNEAMAPFAWIPWIIIVSGFIVLVFVLAAQTVLWRHFIKPIDEIYNGVNEFLAGDFNYTFGVPSAETEGLCYALNTMLAKILGREEEAEEEEEGEGPSGVHIKLGELPESAFDTDDPKIAGLLAEPEDAYYQRLFKEYKVALEYTDEYTEEFEEFKAKVQANERLLKMRFECSAVRFQVASGPDGVILVPLPIK